MIIWYSANKTKYAIGKDEMHESQCENENEFPEIVMFF